MADDTAVTLAKLLDEDAGRILIELQIERARRRVRKDPKWRPVLQAWTALFNEL